MKCADKGRRCAKCREPFDTHVYLCPVPVRKLPFIGYKIEPLISQGFHGSTHERDLAHGIDFLVDLNTPVYAARDGVVVDVATGFTEGGNDETLRHKANFVCVSHDDDRRYTRYVHLASVVCKIGQSVCAGDILGFSGNTGFTSGPHLHFDVVDVHPTTLLNLQIKHETWTNAREVRCVPLGFSRRDFSSMDITVPLYFADPFNLTSASDSIPFVEEPYGIICERGENTFIEKAIQAKKIGATFLIIVDNDAEMRDNLPLLVGGAQDSKEFDIFALFIAYANNRWIKLLRQDSRDDDLANSESPLTLTLRHTAAYKGRVDSETLCKPKTFPISITYSIRRVN